MKNTKNTIQKFTYYIVILFIVSFLGAVYIVQMTAVTGNSMEPELKDGQSVFVNKVAYKNKGPERFDVIVFRYLYKDDEYYLKRVIGLPGETIQIIDGAVYIDGAKLEDPFGEVPIQDAKRAKSPVSLGEDEYFVLGDNRNYSSDSRDYDVGNVKDVQILGKAFVKLWPIEKIGK